MLIFRHKKREVILELLNILAAGAVAWIYGAVHYMVLSKPWLAANNIECDENGRPKGNNGPLPFVLSAIAMIVVAGMMRHMFAMSGITTIGGGAISGFGVGAFFITPWTIINNAYPGRPFMLSAIDGGYAIVGCTLIGIVLNLF